MQVNAAIGRTPARFASSSTTFALFPPSSRKTFFTVADAHSMTRRPVAVEPVKLTASMRGSLARISPSEWSALATTFTIPAGMSVFSAITRPKVVAHQGVSGAGFSTTVQPAASAGPSFAMLRYSGTFQGVIKPATPTASRRRMRPCGRPRYGTSPSRSSYGYFAASSAQYATISIGSSICMNGVADTGAPASATTIARSSSFASRSAVVELAKAAGAELRVRAPVGLVEGAARRGHGAQHVLARAVGADADHLLGRGVHVREGAAVRGGDERAVDQVPGLGVECGEGHRATPG